MKRFTRRLCGLTAALILTAALLVPMACAAVRASDYFAVTSSTAYAQEDGKILIEGDVCATGMMDEIGVKSVTIYEKQSDGYYESVKTYTRYNTTGMIRTNNYEHYVDITYQGTIGKKYYATVAFYAKNSEGNETLYHDSNVVTAVKVP